ncbi:MAG: type I secretion system permease/ATPase [Alphaproteobacteria bacterium]|nr:type I secretion system permease/ATPase [Alphaproteobacteria bacterium]
MSAPSGSSPLRLVLAASRRTIVAAALFSVAINLLMLTGPLYMMQIYDRVIASRSWETLVVLTFIALVALLSLATLDAVRMRLATRVGAFVERHLAPTVFERTVFAALEGQAYRADAVRDLSTLRGFVGGVGLFTLFDVPWLPVFLVVMFMISPPIGWLALVAALVLLALALGNELSTRSAYRKAASDQTAGMRQIEAATRNAEVVDALGMMRSLTRWWIAGLERGGASADRASDLGGLWLAATKFVRMSLQVAVLALGAWLVIEQQLTGGAMIACSIIMSRALAPVEQAVATWKQFVATREAYGRLNAFLTRPLPREPAMPLPPPMGALSVEQLAYRAPGSDQLILRGVSFSVLPGEILGIIGPSGAGKSTLARLLIGVIQPSAGHVRLDGVDIHRWDREELGEHVGYLPQSIDLFGGSVAANIARLRDATPESIVAAATLAGVHELILRLPKGYETDIGEAGARISAGQRQRLALARAVFGQPKILILDEPNSNLDAEGEEALAAALKTLARNGTTIAMVTHRPNLLQIASRVLLLADGAVEAFGSRQAVLDMLEQRRSAAQARRPAPLRAAVPTGPAAE